MFKIINDGYMPKIKTPYGYTVELHSRVDIMIKAGETKEIPLGVKIDLEDMEKLFYNDIDKRNLYFALKAPLKSEKEYSWNRFLKSHFFELKINPSLLYNLQAPGGNLEIDIMENKEICLFVYNPKSSDDENANYKIKAGQDIAQIKLMEHKNFLIPNEYRKY